MSKLRPVCYWLLISLLSLPVSVQAENPGREACISNYVARMAQGRLGKLLVTREGSPREVDYYRTDRFFKKIFPTMSPEDFLGKSVLDIGCGGRGEFVKDLRKAGVKAFGIDLLIDPEGRDLGYLFQRDVLKTGFEDASMDVVTSHYSVFWVEKDNKELMRAAFAEIMRILKPGGRIHLLGPYPEDVIREIPELKIITESTVGPRIILERAAKAK